MKYFETGTVICWPFYNWIASLYHVIRKPDNSRSYGFSTRTLWRKVPAKPKNANTTILTVKVAVWPRRRPAAPYSQYPPHPMTPYASMSEHPPELSDGLVLPACWVISKVLPGGNGVVSTKHRTTMGTGRAGPLRRHRPPARADCTTTPLSTQASRPPRCPGWVPWGPFGCGEESAPGIPHRGNQGPGGPPPYHPRRSPEGPHRQR